MRHLFRVFSGLLNDVCLGYTVTAHLSRLRKFSNSLVNDSCKYYNATGDQREQSNILKAMLKIYLL